MESVNKIILVGYLGRDAELRHTAGGTAVATISLATTDVWNDDAGQRQERTDWHRVIIWGRLAKSLSQYLTKGRLVYVEGQLQTREWTDKNDEQHSTTEVRADSIVLLGGGGSATGVFAQAPAAKQHAKSAGKHAKEAGKEAGKATKNAAEAAAKRTKRVAKKTGNVVKRAAKKPGPGPKRRQRPLSAN